jgi:ABC-2 type transport system permease protein
MRAIWIIGRREYAAYFATPVAVVFIVIFLAMQGALTFNVGGFFDRNQSDLVPFFTYLPWVLLLLVPALTMRQWAEERRQGSIELLLTLPISPWQAVVGKFLAAWGFCKLPILLTFPFWITVNYLGHPDNGAIIAGYLGALLLAGVFLAVGAAVSACTKNQVIAFVLAVSVCFLLLAAGTPTVTEFLARARPDVAQAVRLASVADRYADFTRGVIALRDVLFFVSLIVFFLFVATLVVDEKRAD